MAWLLADERKDYLRVKEVCGSGLRGHRGRVLREETVDGVPYLAVRWSARGVVIYRVLDVDNFHGVRRWTVHPFLEGL